MVQEYDGNKVQENKNLRFFLSWYFVVKKYRWSWYLYEIVEGRMPKLSVSLSSRRYLPNIMTMLHKNQSLTSPNDMSSLERYRGLLVFV